MTLRTRDTDLLWWPIEWLLLLMQADGYILEPGEKLTVVLIVGDSDEDFIKREVVA